MSFKLNWSYSKWYFPAILNEYPSGLMTKSVTGNRRYIRFIIIIITFICLIVK